jgi:endonuclease YncB( thermonuclease family)
MKFQNLDELKQCLYYYKAIIVRWVDGDTCLVDLSYGRGEWAHDLEIRLYGIDTPEKRPHKSRYTKNGVLDEEARQREITAAKDAQSFCESLLPVGTEIVVKTYLDKDGKYGRLLGDIYFESDGQLANIVQILSDNGHEKKESY